MISYSLDFYTSRFLVCTGNYVRVHTYINTLLLDYIHTYKQGVRFSQPFSYLATATKL